MWLSFSNRTKENSLKYLFYYYLFLSIKFYGDFKNKLITVNKI